jgi:hypothetical protein
MALGSVPFLSLYLELKGRSSKEMAQNRQRAGEL